MAYSPFFQTLQDSVVKREEAKVSRRNPADAFAEMDLKSQTP
jgi:hypothetical protein